MLNPITTHDLENLIGKLLTSQVSIIQATTHLGGSLKEGILLNTFQVAVKLNGLTIFLSWSRNTRLLVKSHSLEDYLTGAI